jgi:hypothetical protein
MEQKAAPARSLACYTLVSGLGFLIGGVVVRRTGAFRFVVIVSTACAGVCYAVLASSVIGVSDPLPEY